MKDAGTPTILVIVGITGDLAKRKLLPAIERLADDGVLPEHFRIVGITRRDVEIKDVLAGLPKQAHKHYWFLQSHMEMFRMDLGNPADYRRLRARLNAIDKSFGGAQRLFYLSVPPQISLPIIEHLGKAGFAKQAGTKLLPEKPFGADLDSAEQLISKIKKYFDESQVYRIDHYLAKVMAQNILVFRSGNSLLKRTWSKDFIERIDITASEKIGIEGRATFYEQTGALRDFVQSHLLQLAALTLMDLPKRRDDWQEVPRLRLKALKSLAPPDRTSLSSTVVRGQYDSYAKEVKNPGSQVETFVSLELASSDPRWAGVPITLTTGKALDQMYTEVCLHYRQEEASEANQLVLRIQPKEGIELSLWSKRPGLGREMEQVRLDFEYGAHDLPDAYEQVFLDAINSDHTLFTSSEEVLASWRILAPILSYWSMTTGDLVIYKPGATPAAIIERYEKDTRV